MSIAKREAILQRRLRANSRLIDQLATALRQIEQGDFTDRDAAMAIAHDILALYFASQAA